ncbi:MAG: hypothetical protein AAGI25_11930 [Bacteroidota bacterium]
MTGQSPYHANYNNPVMFTDPLGLCPECPRDKRYYDSRDNFLDYEPTSYVSPNLNGNSWVHSIGRNSRVYERYQMWSDVHNLSLDEYAQKYGEAYTNMNAYWRYYEEEQMVNGVQVKRPQLIISGRVNGGYKQKPNGGSGSDPVGNDGINPIQIAWGVNGIFQMGTEIAVHGPKLKYTGPGDWTKMTRAGSKFGTRLGVAGVALTVVDASIQGEWQNHHTADVLIGSGLTIGAMIPGINVGVAIIGGVYFLTDLGVQAYSGRSITEHLFDPDPTTKGSK